jgi:hypothetical protein
MVVRAGVGSSARRLPAGVQVYRLDADGRLRYADKTGTWEADPAASASSSAEGAAVGAFLRFIDDGQLAHYLLGDASTSPEAPHNATVKLGVVRPHSAFTPHAHAGEHVVLSLGYASCTLHDETTAGLADVSLTPGTIIRIPGMLPHAFANRAATPLLILAANTGFGIDHPDYAITAAEAERRAVEHGRLATAAVGTRAVGTGAVGTVAPPEVDYRRLAAALRAIEDGQTELGLTARERVASWLRRCAGRLENGASGRMP